MYMYISKGTLISADLSLLVSFYNSNICFYSLIGWNFISKTNVTAKAVDPWSNTMLLN